MWSWLPTKLQSWAPIDVHGTVGQRVVGRDLAVTVHRTYLAREVVAKGRNGLNRFPSKGIWLVMTVTYEPLLTTQQPKFEPASRTEDLRHRTYRVSTSPCIPECRKAVRSRMTCPPSHPVPPCWSPKPSRTPVAAWHDTDFAPLDSRIAVDHAAVRYRPANFGQSRASWPTNDNMDPPQRPAVAHQRPGRSTLIAITIIRPAWKEHIGYLRPKHDCAIREIARLRRSPLATEGDSQRRREQELNKCSSIIPEELDDLPPYTRLVDLLVCTARRTVSPPAVPAGYTGPVWIEGVTGHAALEQESWFALSVTILGAKAWRIHDSVLASKYPGPMLVALIVPTNVQIDLDRS